YTADEWLSRFFGLRLYDKMWRPLLIGKFGAFYTEANMAWMWARIHSRTTRLGTYQGGFQAFLEDFASALVAKGVQFRFNTPVTCVERQPDGQIKVESPQGTVTFDAVISTTSPRLLLKMIPTLQGEYARKVGSLRSMGAVVVILALKHQLMTEGTYWLSLPAESPDKTRNEFPFLALVEHTNYMDKRHFGNDHLVYLGDYVSPEHDYFKMSDSDLINLFTAPLQKVNPNFSSDWIRKTWVFRAPYAQPLPTINHSQNIPDVRTSLQGIYWASMSQVYPWDRGTNYAVEIGRRAARLAMEDIK
ncbi:MAG: FAD-dependent oxidoreductase, partial [Anaerolineae bacterium]|nr:FAD-dependent oxidoreductase [Anaerolineae bacterium]